MAKRPLEELVPRLDEVFAFLKLSGDGVQHYNDHFFTEYKRCHLPQANIKVNPRELDGVYQVEVSSDMPAFFVTLETGGIWGEFDDNCFILLHGRPRTLFFTLKQADSFKELADSLKVNHLRATYR